MSSDLLALSARVGAALTERGGTVCTAESCTGGLLLSVLTDCAGASAYVKGGVVTYTDAAKIRLLNLREAVLLAHGAVSEETAAAMAVGALSLFRADFALSVTGIAGPAGGTAEKPVGLTYFGLAAADGRRQVERHVWDGKRLANKASSVEAALRLLLGALEA